MTNSQFLIKSLQIVYHIMLQSRKFTQPPAPYKEQESLLRKPSSNTSESYHIMIARLQNIYTKPLVILTKSCCNERKEIS